MKTGCLGFVCFTTLDSIWIECVMMNCVWQSRCAVMSIYSTFLSLLIQQKLKLITLVWEVVCLQRSRNKLILVHHSNCITRQELSFTFGFVFQRNWCTELSYLKENKERNKVRNFSLLHLDFHTTCSTGTVQYCTWKVFSDLVHCCAVQVNVTVTYSVFEHNLEAGQHSRNMSHSFKHLWFGPFVIFLVLMVAYWSFHFRERGRKKMV